MWVILIWKTLAAKELEQQNKSMSQHLFVILLALLLTMFVAAKSDSKKDNTIDIEALQNRLAEASHLLRYSQFIMTQQSSSPLLESFKHEQQSSIITSINCSCHDYCIGNCFSLMCAPCSPSAFSWPGGQELCYHPGPLGTGLLCHVDRASNTVTENACCTRDGPTCFLPRNSCCEKGDCSTCPHKKNNSREDEENKEKSQQMPATELFPWLNTTEVRDSGYRRRRIFVNNSCRFV